MAINRTLVSWSRTIHIYLSIVMLVILVFFSITGITLNHVDSFTAEPEFTEIYLESLPDLPRDADGVFTQSPEMDAFLTSEFDLDLELTTITIDSDLMFVDYRAPGKTLFLEIDLALGEVLGEATEFGLIAMLNDLHKARDTDMLWKWLIDISAVLLILFSLAGLVLLLPNQFRFKRVAKYSAAATVLISFGYWLGTL